MASAFLIDTTKVYTIEPKLSVGDTIGLATEGLSRHVGTIKSFTVAFDELTQKYDTGLDEFSPRVTTLPTGIREARIEWIKSTRSNLEKLIGKEGILDARNADFWNIWKVAIEVGQDKKIRLMGSHPQFQPQNFWSHALALITLAVGGDIPLNKKDSGNPRYKDAQFYLSTSEEELTLSKDRVKKSRQRNVEMEKLFPMSGGTGGNFERAWSIAYLLGVQKEVNIGIEKLEEVLEIFSPQPEYLDRFLNLCKMEDSELAIDVLIKKAINYDVIKFRTEDKMYYRGGHNFRSTESEVAKYFKVNQNEPIVGRELIEIKDAVSKRDAKQKKK